MYETASQGLDCERAHDSLGVLTNEYSRSGSFNQLRSRSNMLACKEVTPQTRGQNRARQLTVSDNKYLAIHLENC